MNPFVRHLLICEDVRPSPTNPRRRSVHGLIHSVRPRDDESYPVRLSFCVYAVLTSGRGRGTLQVTVATADGGTRVYAGTRREVGLPDDPLEVVGVLVRVIGCPLPKAGLYWVELRYNGEVLAHQPLTAKEPR